MINILIVDDEQHILNMEKRMVERYFKKNEFEQYQIDTAPNGSEASKLMETKEYNIIFLDYMMPVMNGAELLDDIRVENAQKHQPYVCMVTALGTKENLEIFKSKKASSYVLKPFNMDTIFLMLDTYIKIPEEKAEEEVVEFDEFLDFEEFDEFDEFDDMMSDEEKEVMEVNNLNHKKVPAVEFLKDFDDLDYILEDILEIDEILNELIESLDIESFEHFKEDMIVSLKLYSTFLRSLSDFDDIAVTLDLTQQHISKIDLDTIAEKKQRHVIETLRAIFYDLSNWKKTVFITQDAIDVFYIGASSYNSYLLLKDLSPA